jgi:hypothetical protein
LMQRLEQRIIHSSVWLSLYKLYKFIWRTVFYSRSQLERLCRQAVLDSTQGQPFQAYPTASNWLPGRRLLFSLLRRIPFIVINGDGYEQINDADDGQDDKYSSTPPLFSHRLLYQIDRSILYSTQLTVK